MRTFRVLFTDGCLRNEYIRVGEYKIVSFGDTVVYNINENRICQSFFPLYKFKQALREGSIQFTD